MATQQASPQPSTNHAKKKGDKSAAPPDEQFWVRYSPHHEFPLSTLGSVVLHLLLYGAAAFLISTVFWPKDSTDPVKIDNLTVDSGGGGNPDALGTARGDGVQPKERTEQVNKNPMQADPDQLAKNDLPLPQPKINTPKIDVPAARYLPDKGSNAVAQLDTIRKQIQEFKIGPVAGAGKRGPGSGGGEGDGSGPGTGSGTGPGNTKLTPTERRLLRRIIRYDVGDGDLYRRELASLGIILATPEIRRDGTKAYRVYRDLNHIPPVGNIEDPANLRRTFWVDNNVDTVRLLAHAMHIRTPTEFIAFLPPELEEEMLKKELRYKHVKDEKQIKKTVFAVVPTRDGYDVIVESQELYGK